jgi:hypothetical protein
MRFATSWGPSGARNPVSNKNRELSLSDFPVISASYFGFPNWMRSLSPGDVRLNFKAVH